MQIKDNTFCADEGAIGASCFHSLTDDISDLDKPEWDRQRFSWICESPDAFTNWKSAIEALCETTGKCTLDQKQALDKFFSKIDKAKAKVLK